MTKCVLKSIKKKNKLYKKYLSDSSKINENVYKKYKNKLNHVIRLSKKNYYEQELIKYKHDSKMMWKTLNELINRKTKKKEISNEFIDSNSTNSIINPKEIANKFNNYFINIGPNLAKEITHTRKSNFSKYLTGNYLNSMFLDPITEIEVENEIHDLDSNKSPGYDGFNAKIFKQVGKVISKPLTHIFNLTFTTGIIPEQIKTSLVTPIFKSNEENKFENYRPISVLTCFAKILEKLMYKRLINYVEKNKILSEHQYGFRKNRSTELAIIELVNKITK